MLRAVGERLPEFTRRDHEALQQVLPGYEIGEVLGRGATGYVVAGRHRRLGRDVALKQIVYDTIRVVLMGITVAWINR